MSLTIKNKLQQNINVNEEKIFVKQIRQNIKELNRSMQNIEKMIERSRKLFNDHPLENSRLTLKNKIKITSNYSFPIKDKSYNPLFGNQLNASNISSDMNATVCVKDKSKQPIKVGSIVKNNRRKTDNNQQLCHSIEKNALGTYHFSPQKTKSSASLTSGPKSKSIRNPENKNVIVLKPKHNRFLSDGNIKSKLRTQNKQSRTAIIGSAKTNSFSKIQCKTQYKDEGESQTYQNSKAYISGTNSKKQISIKLFSRQTTKKKQQLELKQVLMDRGFKVQPPFLTKIKMKQASTNENEQESCLTYQIKKNKFAQKISQYKFAENYLNKNEIWAIFDKLISENVPELKWPIVIVDQVYKKIQNPK